MSCPPTTSPVDAAALSPPRRRLTPADEGVWDAYGRGVAPLRRNDEVAPLRHHEAARPSDGGARSPISGPTRDAGTPESSDARRTASPIPPWDRAASSAPGPSQGALRVGAQPAGLDRANWQRLRSGRMAPERRLDLHGLTARHARLVVARFLHAGQADGVRCVEIVTGRGEGEAGVLKRELPLWLNLPELRPLVLAAAHPHAANPGAVRLLLRRVR